MSANETFEKALAIAARIEDMGPIEIRRYFGGAALVAREIQFAILMGGRLYLRADNEMRVSLRALGGRPFAYQGQSGIIDVAAYYEAPPVVVNDRSQLTEYAIQAHRTASAVRRRRKRARKVKPRATP